MVPINEILDIIPHRYPFLLVDRVLEIVEKTSAVGIKNVTVNEPFFQGHFPGNPVMPAVLIVEGMAQVGAVMLLASMPDRKKKLIYFTGIDGARFRRPIVPGDQIRYELEVINLKSRACKMRGRALVDGQLAAEAEILSAMVDVPGVAGS
jgi:beta-hydroxyacyl-ACP dehydratase FabZ